MFASFDIIKSISKIKLFLACLFFNVVAKLAQQTMQHIIFHKSRTAHLGQIQCKGPFINYVTLSGGGEGVSSCIVVQIVGRMVFIMLLGGLGVKLGTKLC